MILNCRKPQQHLRPYGWTYERRDSQWPFMFELINIKIYCGILNTDCKPMTPNFISPGPVLSDLQTHVSNCLLGVIWIGISSRILDFVSQTHLAFSLLHIGKERYYSPICSGQKSWSWRSLTLLLPSCPMQSNSKSFYGTFQESPWSVHSSCPSWRLLYSKPLSFLTTTVGSYLICFLSCPLESILLPEIKMTFEKKERHIRWFLSCI